MKTVKDYGQWIKCVAYLLQENNQNKEAIALWETLDRNRPSDPMVLASLAYGYFETEEYQKAIATAEPVLAISADPAISRTMTMLISRAHLALGQDQEARQWADKFKESING